MRKTKPSDIELAFHSHAQSEADLNNSEKSTASFFLPSLVAKLDLDEKPEVRLSAIKSLIEIFTKSCAHQRDDRMNDTALASLREIIINKCSKSQHNEALRLICAISAGRRSDFSSRAKMLISDILPSIGYLSSEYEAYRAFAISFLVANSVEGREDSLDIFKVFLDVFISATTTGINLNKAQNKNKHRNKVKKRVQNNHDKDNDDNINNNDINNNDINNNDINNNDINNNDINSNDSNNNDSNINNEDDKTSDNQNGNSINSADNQKNEITEENDINSIENAEIINNNDNNSKITDLKDENNKEDENSNIIGSNENENIEKVETTSIEEPMEINNIEISNIQENSNVKDDDDESNADNSNNPVFVASPVSFASLKRRTKNRGSTQSLRELIQGATLIASALPAEAAAEDLIDELKTVISICIGNENEKDDVSLDPLLVIDGLDLFLVLYECLYERHQELHISMNELDISSSDSSQLLKMHDFISHFRPLIETLPLRVNTNVGGNKGKNKAKEKALRSKVSDVLRCVDGCSKRQLDLAFNAQHVTIEGARRVILAEAVKRVTQKNFLSHLQSNPALQSDLGFSLVSNQTAVKLIKRFKSEIKQERVVSKKEREMDRMKKRKMKETGNLYE